MSSIYDWITSLLRRRGQKKSVTNKESHNDQESLPHYQINPSEIEVINGDEINEYTFYQYNKTSTKTILYENTLSNIAQDYNDYSNNRQLEMDNKKSSKSNESSIEEDIPEEILTASDISEKTSDADNKIPKIRNLKNIKRQLFGFGGDENNSKNTNKLEIETNIQETSEKKQDFEKNASKTTSIKKNPERKSKSITKSQNKENVSDEQQSFSGAETTNQSTTNDVSEMLDEEHDHQLLKTKSLELSRNVESFLNIEKRDCQSLDTIVNVGTSFSIFETDNREEKHNSSIEQDKSDEEVIESNHSIELSLFDKDLSSLDPNIDINNEEQMKEILGETPTKFEKSSSNKSSSGKKRHFKVKSDKSTETTDKLSSGQEENISKEDVTLKSGKGTFIEKSTSEQEEEEEGETMSDDIKEKISSKSEKLATKKKLSCEQDDDVNNIEEKLSLKSDKSMASIKSSSDQEEKEELKNFKEKSQSKSGKSTPIDKSNSENEEEVMNVDKDKTTLKSENTIKENVSISKENTPSKSEKSTTSDDKSSSFDHCEKEMNAFKEKLLSLNKSPPQSSENAFAILKENSFEQNEEQKLITIKSMERVHSGDFEKEILEDITEESEKYSITDQTIEEQQQEHEKQNNFDFDSVISLNMIQMLENKVKELENIVSAKDVCLTSLNLQLDAAQKRELYANLSRNGDGGGDQDSLKDIPPSGRESTSLATTTTSTEYRTIQEDLGNKLIDFHFEIQQKNTIIEKLTESLQQSMKVREQLQEQSDQLNIEVQHLRKQLTDTLDTVKRSSWPPSRSRDQESIGQRLSEISIDLVSESDEDLERQILTDNEEQRYSISTRNSRERQLSNDVATGNMEIYDPELIQPINKQIEQFQKYLNPDELRVFFMVQKKFDDLLSQEIEKSRMKFDNEMKLLNEQIEVERHDKEMEINRLRQLLANIKGGSTELIELRQELEAIHSSEMEKLRLYFEKKCADLEKQFSEEVFSQKSARDDSITSGSELSEHEQENIQRTEESEKQSAVIIKAIKDTSSPRRKTRKELYSSPSHRQITPITVNIDNPSDQDTSITVNDLKTFYQEKIQDIKKNYEEIIRRQNDKIKLYEARYSEDDFMNKLHKYSHHHNSMINNDDGQGITTSSYLIIDEDEAINASQEIRTIAAEYEKRLQEQIALAKEDILHELENQIQALLSETTTDDHHWPPELILLREKFTAKSQLEIAQLQIKHEEEMARLKADYEKQLNRKSKRNSTFDLSRDLDQIVSDRENLRELSSTFRWLLCELAKYVTICEEDFNSSFMEELNKLETTQDSTDGKNDQQNQQKSLNDSLNESKRMKFGANVTTILNVIDDPQLVEFITNDKSDVSFNLKDCLEKLKSEANYLLKLSENFSKHNKQIENEEGTEKNDSCEEEDGLKSGITRTPKKVTRTNSLNDGILRHSEESQHKNVKQRNIFSLPASLQSNEKHSVDDVCDGGEGLISPSALSDTNSELNLQVHELKNRLLKSENDRQKLQKELDTTITRNIELGQELNALKEQLEQLDASHKEEYSEGYTLGQIKSPQRIRPDKPVNSFSQLQEKARNFLSTPTKSMNDNSQMLLHMIEEFCREGDKVIDDGKKEKEDLQLQIEAADKQLKAIRQFLDDQAAERELERDEFVKEIEKLKNQIKEREKERSSFEIASKEMEQMEQQIKDLNQKILESESKKDKIEIELKASIDKIFVLREIISELENQVETKSLSEHILSEKVKELEIFIATQTRSNENLQHQVENLKTEIGQGYEEKITYLEEQLKNSRPSAEQSVIWNQIAEQLRDIETTLEQKIKTLEALHHSVCSTSCSTSPIEDVSVQGECKKRLEPQKSATSIALSPTSPKGSPISVSPRSSSLPIDEVQRVYEKLAKHTRVEEAAIKRIKDLEMQVVNIRTNFAELQHERDILQEKMSEQLQRISALQSKLDEQRYRTDEITRNGTSDLTIRIHDLQNEIQALKETLSVRDKQITNLKKQLEQSKLIIERQEAELANGLQIDHSKIDKLELELQGKIEENRKLKEKMKTEMINKIALPDLMETMLADKNDEIDHLKEQLDSKEKELQGALEINLSRPSSAKDNKSQDESIKSSARTLSDIKSISEYDEPEAIRREPLQTASPLIVPDAPHLPEQTMEPAKTIVTAADVVIDETITIAKIPSYNAPNYFQPPNQSMLTVGSTPSLMPRKINFSDFTDDSKLKGSTPKNADNAIDETDDVKDLNVRLKEAEDQIESLKISKESMENEKNSEIQKLKGDLLRKTELLQSLEKEKHELSTKVEELTQKLEMYLKLGSELKAKEKEISDLEKQFTEVQKEFERIENDLKSKDNEIISLKQANQELNMKYQKLSSDENEKIQTLQQKIDDLQNVIEEKDEILTKQQKDLINWQKNEKDLQEKIEKLQSEAINVDHLKDELSSVKSELSQKMLQYEKSLLDIQAQQKEINILKTIMNDKDAIIATVSNGSKNLQEIITQIQQKLETNQNLNDIKEKLNEEKQRSLELEHRNSVLEIELEKLRTQNNTNSDISSSKPYSFDEIAEKVEKEINYSVQLDSNILKVIENEEENKKIIVKTDHEKLIEKELQNQIQSLRNDIEVEKVQKTKIQQELNDEKRYSQEIQQQDAEIIQALRIRLEEALKKEEELHKILDDERIKYERLMTQITVLQRSEARKNGTQLRSPPDSPRKLPRDFESDLAERLKTEIKLLTAQNERERERVIDLQRVLEREKIRFETELSDRITYSEKLKKEMEKITHEKNLIENQAEHLEERLLLSSKEIESLEARISTLQEAETRRAHRRGKERIENTQNAVELQELKSKVVTLESERDHLNQIIATLRADIERSAQRETKLAEALANSGLDATVPEQFMQKLKEMNYLLSENTKDNHQMTEAFRILTEERKSLQKRIDELEMYNQSSNTLAANLMEMEERANHLFGRYLRTESHRKALVHQKRYLMIVIQTYQENEIKTLALLNVNVPKKSRKKFKSIVLVVIAIQRMKFIVRRWQTGKRIVSKSIFHVQAQKRSTLPTINNGLASISPTNREKSATIGGRINYLENPLKPLHTPGLISDISEQKTDWTRWKK